MRKHGGKNVGGGALHEEREFKAVFDSALDGIAILDDAGRYVDVNPAACVLYGVARADIVGRRIGDSGALGVPADVERLWNALLTHGEYKGEFRLTQADGTAREVAYTAKAHFLPGRHLAILRDVSEQKRIQSELQHRSEELEAANKELQAFSYSVSHDLRTPLMNITGYVELLFEEYAEGLGPLPRQYLHHVRSAAERMTQILEALLRLSGTSGDLRREPIDLSAAVAALAANLRRAEPERAVEFVITPQLVTNGDRKMLSIALENLLNNAWKFTKREPRPRIEFGAAQRQEGVVYFVRDNGAGFDARHADKLFGAFQRLHTQKEFPGTGVGLATVQRIITRHGGRVWAEGAVGQGATFYFTL